MTPSYEQPRPSRRRRVVTMLDTIRRLGGAETIAVDTAVGLSSARFESWLCVTRWNSEWLGLPEVRAVIERLDGAGVRFLGIERRSRASLTPWMHLVHLLREQRVDVLHSHMFGSNVWASLLGSMCRVPVLVAHEHNWAFAGSRIRPFLDRNVVARGADVIVAVSESARRQMVETERIPAGKVRLIRNGVPDRAATGDPGCLRAQLGVPEGARLVGSVGHLRREKAFEVLIEAAAGLRQRFPDAVVVIAGDGPERGSLERAISARGLEGAVRLLGHRDDIPDLLRCLEVAVCCSDFEGGPLSVIEYMVAGLPIAATAVGGIPELVENGVSGLLVPQRDPVALADSLATLLDDDGLRRRLGNASRSTYEQGLRFSTYLASVEGLYDELIAGAAGRGSRSHS